MRSSSADKTPVHAAQQGRAQAQPSHLRPEDRLGDLLDHPAFRGFSRLMLPWDGRDYDKAMPLKDIGQLLPYHSAVVPAVVVAALNRMVDDADAGRTVFYNFYTDGQRQARCDGEDHCEDSFSFHFEVLLNNARGRLSLPL